MKTINLFSRLTQFGFTTRARRLLFCLVLAIGAGTLIGFSTGGHDKGFIAHEWGTFTSVQGADGALMDWRPLESSHLPKFVYEWQHSGLNRQSTSPFGNGQRVFKSAMLTLQRMETPVIYFYADKEQTVDVSVSFPQGLITEWYPQADQIGPSTVPASPMVATLDHYAHKAGAKPDFTFASLLRNQNVKESRVRWAQVEILPAKQNASLAGMLPLDRSGSHYFSARDTDAEYLRVESLAATNPAPEHEKFIFYRGVGNFATPLRVTMNSGEAITLANTGQEPLAHLFVLGLENGVGRFLRAESLAAGAERAIPMDLHRGNAPQDKLSAQLCQEMAEALVQEGLYRREAAAMVNTWKDSWFAEDGLRVLYVLPRAWTDRTLPMALDPRPRELVRVMVGRAEVITPLLAQKLSDELVKAKEGDAQARDQVVAEFRKLGRFAQPAWSLATRGLSGEISQTGWTLLQAAAKPATVGAAAGEPAARLESRL